MKLSTEYLRIFVLHKYKYVKINIPCHLNFSRKSTIQVMLTDSAL